MVGHHSFKAGPFKWRGPFFWSARRGSANEKAAGDTDGRDVVIDDHQGQPRINIPMVRKAVTGVALALAGAKASQRSPKTHSFR